MTKNSEALLSLISASIGGRDGLYKHGNVLLDSGAQISLIRLETATSLGLEGKSVSITITKVGGEEEEMITKVFNVQVTSLDNKKTFPVKAIGIPCISDDIVDIKTKDIIEGLGLKKKTFTVVRDQSTCSLVLITPACTLVKRDKLNT